MCKIQNDVPIENSEDDCLGRTLFAKSIASIIYDLKESDIKEQGIVFGLSGQWGSGKTSLINLIKNTLIEKGYTKPDNSLTTNVWNYIIKAILILLVCSFNLSDYLHGFIRVEQILDAFPAYYSYLIFDNIIVIIIKVLLIANIIFLKPFENFFKFISIQSNIFLNKIFKRSKSKLSPIILDFSPWKNFNEESIIKDFFNILEKNLYSISSCEEKRNFQTYVSKILYKCSNGLLNIENDEDILTIKERINNSLRNSKRRFIIFIDDLDRLSSSEIAFVFKIIKSIANLPNIIYFISYDEHIVSSALNINYAGQGTKFLEKIIQVHFEMPISTQNNLDKYLKNELEKLLNKKELNNGKWEQKYDKYWTHVFSQNFVLLFNTVRDIKRFINAFYVTFTDNITNEVNIVDFWFITAIKLFFPDLKNFIKLNKEFLTQKIKYDSTFSVLDEHIKIIKGELDAILNKECSNLKLRTFMFRTLLTVFPSLECIDNKALTLDFYDEKSRMTSGRICCVEHFDKYFMYDIDDTIFTNTYINNVIIKAKNKEAFYNDLEKLDDRRELKTFFKRFEDFIDNNINKGTRINIINTLFLYGDYFNSYDDDFLDYDIYVAIERIIYQILELDDNNSIDILEQSFSVEKSLMPALTYIWLINNMIISKQNVGYANETEYNYYSGQMIKAIKEWANNDLCNKDDFKKPYKGRLIEHRDARYLLQYWQQNENGNDLKNYVSKMTQTNSGLLKFIDKLKSKTKTSDGTNYKIKCHIYGYDLKPFFNDLESLKNRLINIDRNLLKDEEITILDMILKDIDNRERLR